MVLPDFSSVTSDWFNYIGSCPVLKSEYGDKFLDLIEAKRGEAKAELKDFMERVKKNGTSVKLSREDLAYLSARYDPQNMTSEEYRAFVDDLCRLGVFEEADKPHVSYSLNIGGTELVPVDIYAPSITVTPDYSRFSSSFSSSGGNVLGWSRHLSTFEYFNADTKSFEKTRSAILFDMMQDILNQMAVA